MSQAAIERSTLAPGLLAQAWITTRRSEKTRQAYRSDVVSFGRFLAGSEIDEQNAIAAAAGADDQCVAEWRDKMKSSERPPSTIQRRISALRSWFRYLVARHYREDNPASLVECDPVSPALQRAPWLDVGEIRALCRVASTGRHAKRKHRNLALILLGAGIGLRRAEILGIRARDYNPVDGKLIVAEAKGRRVRIVQAPAELKPHLWSICNQLPPDERLFKITPQRFCQLLARWSQLADIPRARVTPHALRRSCATIYLDRGGSIERLRRLLGHSDTRTTSRYDRRDSEQASVEYGIGGEPCQSNHA